MSSYPRLAVAATMIVVGCGLVSSSAPASASTPASKASSASRPATAAAVDATPDGASASCSVVLFYTVNNPSMNKPRGDQQTPDHRSWTFGCL